MAIFIGFVLRERERDEEFQFLFVFRFFKFSLSKINCKKIQLGFLKT